MTDFERKPGGKRNLNANGSDPMAELTRLLQREDSSVNQQGIAQNHNTQPVIDPQTGNYVDPRFSGDEGFSNYNFVNDENYVSEDHNDVGSTSSYQGGNDGTYSGQHGDYWGEENSYPPQQNQYSEDANYYNSPVEGQYEYNNPSASGNEYYPLEGENNNSEQFNEFRENSNSENSGAHYQAANSESFDWNDYNAQPQSNQHAQGYNFDDQSGGHQDPSFLNESAYQSQTYSDNNSYQSNAESYPLSYEDNLDYNESGEVSSQFVNPESVRQATDIYEAKEFIDSETQYWTDGPNDVVRYRDEQSAEPQWTASFDDNEQFVNEFGLEPNQGIYKNDENASFLPNDVAGAPRVVSDSNLGSENSQFGGLRDNHFNDVEPFHDQPSPYSSGPDFVEELTHDYATQGQAVAPVGHEEETSHSGFSKENANLDSLGSVKPLGAIIAPMRMATQQRSFLGYGQAVAVVPTRGQNRPVAEKSGSTSAKPGFALSRSNPVATQKTNVDKAKPFNNSSPIGRGVNPFLVGNADQKNTKNASAANNSEFEDALNDFNLTIKGDEKKRYKRDANLKTVRPDQNAVPETQSFDLPPVHYENGNHAGSARNPFEQEFSDVLAPGVRDLRSNPNNGFGNSELTDELVQVNVPLPLQEVQPLYSDGSVDASKYDWAASQEMNQVQGSKSGAVKKILLAMGLLAFILACIGFYYAFIGDTDTSNTPVVIQRDAGDVKVAPPVDANANQSNQDQAVYNRVESNNTPQTQQSELIDHSEAPVDLDKVDEQAPSANETSLEPNSVESRVLEATQNSLAVHEVPTVTIRDNNNVNGDDINSIIASQQERVLTPGQSFKEHLQSQSDDQQALPNDGLQTGTEVASNNVAGDTNDNNGASQTVTQNQEQGIGTNGAANSVQLPANAEQTNNGGLASLSANNNVRNENQLGSSPVNSNSEVEAGSAPQPSNPTSSAVENSSAPSQVGSNLAAGTFYVQIASQPNREAAQQSLADFKRQPAINSLIANHQVVIVAADIPGRGTYYRVRVAANNQANANQLCNQLKDLQVSCFVGK